MNNIEKKLDALIDALGFNIEEVKTTVTPRFSFLKAALTDRYSQQGPITTIDYKVTKKPNPIDKLYDGITLDQLVRNIFDMSMLDNGSRFINYPKESFDAVVDYFCNNYHEGVVDLVGDDFAFIIGVEVSSR